VFINLNKKPYIFLNYFLLIQIFFV